MSTTQAKQATEVIDWARFVPTSVIDPRPASECRYRDGDIIACAASGNSGQVVASVRKVYRDGICADTLAGAGDWWTSTQTRLIRHADGTWAPGYDASGAIAGKAASGCEDWCGLPYGHGDVPLQSGVGKRAFCEHKPGPAGGVSAETYNAQPAFCSAVCLQRAQAAGLAAGLNGKAASAPVAPWTLMHGQSHPYLCTSWIVCGRDEYAPARYMDARRNKWACEACAERAGVFGLALATDPITGRLLPQKVIPAPASKPTNVEAKANVTKPCPACNGIPFETRRCPRCGLPSKAEPVRVRLAPAGACVGPLAVHGVAVMRWTTQSPVNSGARQELLCDECHLFVERKIAGNVRATDECTARDARPVSVEPPARVGTVPQVFGLNVGILGARGMRG